jgi:predicted sugar kinase
MRRIGALAALGVMTIALGTLVLAGGDADEPANPAPAGPIVYDHDFDSDQTHAPLTLEQDQP